MVSRCTRPGLEAVATGWVQALPRPLFGEDPSINWKCPLMMGRVYCGSTLAARMARLWVIFFHNISFVLFKRATIFYDRGRNTRWVENLIDQERWLLKQAYLLNQPRQFFESNAFRPTNSLIILQWLKLVFNVIQKKLWGKKSVLFRITNFNQENVETQLIAFFPSWYKSTLQRSSLSLKALLPNRVHIFSPFSHRMTNGRKLAIKKYRAGADVFDNNATRERTYCERSLPLSSRRRRGVLRILIDPA